MDVTGLLLCQGGLGGGNVSSSGNPMAGQMAQWIDVHTIQGIGTTGTGNAVLATSPVLVTPIFSGTASGSVSGTAAALAATPAQCTAGQFATGVTAAGAANCSTPAGSGNVNNVGTPTSGQLGVWTGATTIQGITLLPAANMPAFTGDVTKASGSLATTVIAVNNGTIPLSKTLVGTNGSGQFIDSSSATLSNNTTGTAAALGATPALCSPGQAAQGVLANGNATGCFTPSTLSGLAVGSIPQVGSGGNNLVNSSPTLDNGVTNANSLTYAGSGGIYATSFNPLNPASPIIFQSSIPGGLPGAVAAKTQLTVGPDSMWHASYNGGSFTGGLVAEPGTNCVVNQLLYVSTANTGSAATAWSCAGLTAPLAISGGNLGFATQGNGTLVQMSTGFSSQAIATWDGSGNIAPGNIGFTLSSNGISQIAVGTIGVTYLGSRDDVPGSNIALGSAILRGSTMGTISGTSSSAYAGSVGVWGGLNQVSNASSGAGHVQVFGGQSTGATQGLQGLNMIGASYKTGGTVTQWNLECFSAAMTVTDCGASPAFVIGVAELVGSNSVQVITSQQMFINASAAVTLGHTACAGATAGKVTDSGGTAVCATGPTFVVMAISGTYGNFPDGLGPVTATNTLPLVQKVMK